MIYGATKCDHFTFKPSSLFRVYSPADPWVWSDPPRRWRCPRCRCYTLPVPPPPRPRLSLRPHSEIALLHSSWGRRRQWLLIRLEWNPTGKHASHVFLNTCKQSWCRLYQCWGFDPPPLWSSETLARSGTPSSWAWSSTGRDSEERKTVIMCEEYTY